MKYFKNIEIAKEFAINPTTVQNWIDACIEGKNKLQLIKVNKRNYIINNSHNLLIIEKLVGSSRKYKHKSNRKVVTADKKLFEHFGIKQIADIVNSIEIHSEIPHKYTYINGGATIWSNYVKRSVEEKLANTITNTTRLLDLAHKVIVEELLQHQRVNIVDIGCGESSPIKEFFEILLKEEREIDYSAIDISEDMLKLSESNIQNWFGDRVKSQFITRDINHQGVEDILFEYSRGTQGDNCKNLILFLGSTIENQIDYTRTLSNISSSLGENDLLLIGITLDNESAKVYFDFSSQKKGSQVEYLDQEDMYKDWQDFIVPSLLGLGIDDFSVELFYNEEEHSRMTQLICNKDVDIVIKNEKIDTIVSLYKGQKLTTWRHRHHSMGQIVNILEQNSLGVKHVVTSLDEAHALLICRRT